MAVTTILRWRKKPVEIEAFQFAMPMPGVMPEWLRSAFRDGTVYYQGGDEPYLTIKTLEGDHRAALGDWIIRGVKGELYPCKPDIFEAIYEPAE